MCSSNQHNLLFEMSKTAVGKNILAEAETIVIHLQPMNVER
jgi:hypothetical protein